MDYMERLFWVLDMYSHLFEFTSWACASKQVKLSGCFYQTVLMFPTDLSAETEMIAVGFFPQLIGYTLRSTIKFVFLSSWW